MLGDGINAKCLANRCVKPDDVEAKALVNTLAESLLEAYAVFLGNTLGDV